MQLAKSVLASPVRSVRWSGPAWQRRSFEIVSDAPLLRPIPAQLVEPALVLLQVGLAGRLGIRQAADVLGGGIGMRAQLLLQDQAGRHGGAGDQVQQARGANHVGLPGTLALV